MDSRPDFRRDNKRTKFGKIYNRQEIVENRERQRPEMIHHIEDALFLYL